MPESAAPTKPRIRWYVYGGGYGTPLVKMPREATMRGTWPGYDAECVCGWESRTGGAVRRYVEGMVTDHKSYDCPLRAKS